MLRNRMTRRTVIAALVIVLCLLVFHEAFPSPFNIPGQIAAELFKDFARIAGGLMEFKN